MGLMDKLLGKPSDPGKDTSLISQSEKKGLMDQNEIEKAIASREGQLSLTDCLKCSFTDVAALGTGFAQMLPALRTVATTVTVDGAGYIPINDNFPGVLKAARKSTPNIFVGSFKDAASGKSVFADFVKAGPQTVTSATTMPINPAVIIMAGMLVQIEKKLDMRVFPHCRLRRMTLKKAGKRLRKRRKQQKRLLRTRMRN